MNKEAVKVIKEWLPELELMARYNTSSIDYQRYKALNTAIEALEKEQKTGHWIETDSDDACWYMCSECHRRTDETSDYCSNCGCAMAKGVIRNNG